MVSSIKLKIKFFIIFYILLAFLNVQIFSQCIDYSDVLDHNIKRNVPCPLVTDNIYKRSASDDEPKLELVGFDCNNATEEICEDVKNTFYVVRELFSETFTLNTPVLIKLNFTNLCEITPEVCDPIRGLITIGGSHSVRDILMLDDDGITRYYPQSLVKQFQFETHPEFAPLDVILTFNSVVEWYFPSDGSEIQPKQLDLVYTMLHEMVHSLGFNSHWNQWFVTSDPDQYLVTPRPVVDMLDNAIIFEGFKETAFDKHIIINNNNENLTQIAAKLNEFAKPGTTFMNVSDLIQHFLDSEQLNLAVYMNNVTTTPKTISHSCEGEKAILDTSLKPFQTGLNVDHLQQPYINTTDFLMTTVQSRGKTLDDLIEFTDSVGPIGPKTQIIMECMGLATKNNPYPYRPQLTP